MSTQDRKRWDIKYQERDYIPAASDLLKRHTSLLTGGIALDVACGSGQNSVWLAQLDYRVLGVDISRAALLQARRQAVATAVEKNTLFVQVDLDTWRPPIHTFDLVMVFRFLDRSLLPSLEKSILPGGLFFYYTRHTGILGRLPDANRTFLLERGELAAQFAGWQVLYEHEGPENASIVARKRPSLHSTSVTRD